MVDCRSLPVASAPGRAKRAVVGCVSAVNLVDFVDLYLPRLQTHPSSVYGTAVDEVAHRSTRSTTSIPTE